MTLYTAHKYLTDNYSAFSEVQVPSNLTSFHLAIFILVFIVIGLVGIAVLMNMDKITGTLILIFAVGGCIVITTSFNNITDKYEAFDADKYREEVKKFNADLLAEMTKEETKTPKTEVTYTSFTVINRITLLDNPIYDISIDLDGDTILRRVRVVSTDNPNLIGKYRELPDYLPLDSQPFTFHEGYLFVKDIEEIKLQHDQLNK